MSKTRRLPSTPSRAAISAIASRGVALGATFALAAIVSRRLSPEQAGTFFVMVALSVAGATIGRWGTDTYALKMAAAGLLGRHGLSRLLIICATRSFGAAILAAFAATQFVPGGPALGLMVSVILASFGTAIAVFFGSALRGFGQIGRGVMVETGMTPLATVAALILIHSIDSLDSAMMAYAVGALSAPVMGLLLIIRCRPRASDMEDLVLGRDAERSRFAMMATATLFYLLTWAPVLTLGYLNLPREAAYFSIAARVANFINLVPVLQNSYIAPQLARENARGHTSEVSRIASRAARHGLMIAAPAAILISASPRFVTAIFGQEYLSAVLPMRVLVLGAVVAISMGPVNPVMLTCGREGAATALNGVLLVATIVGILLTANRYGTTGVAIVSALTIVGYAAFAMASLARTNRIHTAAWSRT